MPYEIKKDFGDCDGYAVTKEGSEKILGCHSTREKAQNQVAAIYSVEEKVLGRRT